MTRSVHVDQNLTRKVADLARLELSDEEVKTFTTQLGDILKYVDLLSGVSTDGIEPMTQPFVEPTPLRKDEVRTSPVNSSGLPKTLDCAPEVIDGGFKVPPIL